MHITVRKCVCPLCGSDIVKGFKVHDGKEWWSYCIHNYVDPTFDHGMVIYRGKLIDATKREVWFSESGKIELNPLRK